MGKRSTSRRLAMQILYQHEVSKLSVDQILEQTFSEEEFLEETREFASRLVKGVISNSASIDGLIAKHAKEWKLDRLSAVDKSILRLAIYELKCLKENPPSVVINEAILLAKKYSSAEASKFINGILGTVLKEI